LENRNQERLIFIYYGEKICSSGLLLVPLLGGVRGGFCLLPPAFYLLPPFL